MCVWCAAGTTVINVGGGHKDSQASITTSTGSMALVPAATASATVTSGAAGVSRASSLSLW